MNRLFLIIITLLMATGAYSQNTQEPQLPLHPFNEVTSANALPNLMALFNQKK